MNTQNKRIALHIGFWVVYTLMYALLNTSFASTKVFDYPPLQRFLLFWGAELILLPIKLIAAYGFLYYLLPKFILKRKYFGVAIRLLLCGVILLGLNRLMVYNLVYPLIYQEFPDFPFFSASRIFYSLIDILSAVALASTIKLLRGRLLSQRREEDLRQEKLQSELSFLRAQTNPHFLFNTLNNIYALARKQSGNTAPVVMKLSQILRFMLYECSSPTIPVKDEIEVIQDFIELEQLRYNKRLSIEFNQDVDNPAQPIAPLLLLPLVENAFKHGASETRFDTFIHITLSLKNEQFNVNIRNSKDEESQSTGSGIGLKNVRRQLELIYPSAHELVVENEDKIFTVSLSIDLKKAS